ncbi:MAG: hypothetical protein IJW40_01240 [Clostridia bacterium]|nr:hypothetical protein [Clostridia bacterium]
MTPFDLYIFFLCLIVFTLLTGLFTVMLTYIIKQQLRLIAHGLEDERIKKEYEREINRSRAARVVCRALGTVLLAIVFLAFAASVYIQLASDRVSGSLAVPKVVMSTSMQYQHRENEYLTENGLEQISMFDIIFVHELPAEEELELYDIVIYEYQDQLIIHRIVGIEEPNAAHPDERYFLLRGDSNKYSDEFPVLYEQMMAIYRGQRIPFIGSFFAFMQSPAGYLCILLVLFAVIATPIAEKKLWAAMVARLKEIGYIPHDDGQGGGDTAENAQSRAEPTAQPPTDKPDEGGTP